MSNCSKPRKMNKGGMVPTFKTCPTCPTPAKCKAAGKCLKKGGYNKGGLVKANCGASTKPNRKARK